MDAKKKKGQEVNVRRPGRKKVRRPSWKKKKGE